MIGRIALAILLLAPEISAQAVPTTAPKVVVIRAARLIDRRHATTIANPVIIVEDHKAQAVGSNLSLPTGAEVISTS